jgi:cell division transport system ATP-binding protein
MIHLKSLSKAYASQNRVLDQIQLEIKKGEFVYVLGGTGAGKTSLLKLLAGEEEPTGGELWLFGYSIRNSGENTKQAIRRSIGYIPQKVELLSDFTVFENIALGVSYGGSRLLRSDTKQRIIELLDKLQLLHRKDALARELSGGEAQRVAVIRALARQPELIIADEPTGSQDFQNTWSVMDLLLRANITGTTVIVATHDRDIVRRVKKKCVHLSQGRLQLEEANLWAR